MILESPTFWIWYGCVGAVVVIINIYLDFGRDNEGMHKIVDDDLFAALILGALWPLLATRNACEIAARLMPSKCSRGHRVSAEARFCPRRGEQIARRVKA